MNSAFISLSEASELTGKNRTTLYRWIKKGKMSATLIDGDYRVDVAELRRVCTFVDERNDASTSRNNNTHQHIIDTATMQELASLRAEVTILRDVMQDYRSRLDKETEERMRLTRLLEHHNAQNVSQVGSSVGDAVDADATETVQQNEQMQSKKSRFRRIFGFK